MTRARIPWVLAALYLALLALSHALSRPPSDPQPDAGAGRLGVAIQPQDDRGPLAGPEARLSLLHWPAAPGTTVRPAVLCLHGSPGSARNFDHLGPRLAAGGFDVWALDLPGFGHSAGPVGRYSILAHARAALAALDTLGLGRVHVVGWSMGGGVALHMAELEPARVASLALVASIGVQEAEGSGNYGFEHAKYLALLGAFGLLEHLVPRFGALDGFLRAGRAFALNFWHSDQRPLRALMQRLPTPTLILHGREDFLAPWWAAEISHQLIAPSRLVLFDAGHFLPIAPPFGQADAVAGELEGFLARHDEPGAIEPRQRIEPDPPPAGLRALEPAAFSLPRLVPWWLQAVALALLAARSRLAAGAVAGTLVAAVQLDFGLAALSTAAGASIAVLVRQRRRLGTRALWRAVLAALVPCGWLVATLVLSLLLQPVLRQWLAQESPRSFAPLLALALLGVARALVAHRRRRLALRPPSPAGP